ncbi:MAG: hypothetical protein RL338_585 [Chloroflexota bacterium]
MSLDAKPAAPAGDPAPAEPAAPTAKPAAPASDPAPAEPAGDPATLRARLALPFRAAIALGVLGLSLAHAFLNYKALIDVGGGSFQTADWLIDYSGGLVRRGLAGQLLLSLGLSASMTLQLLWALQSAAYAAIGGFCVWYLRRTQFAWSSIALVCAPAALPFIGNDPWGAYRKELLLLVTLLLLAVALRQRRGRPSLAAGLTLGALVVYLVAAFSWEPAFVALPAIRYLLITGPAELGEPTRDERQAWWLAVGIATVGFAVNAAFPGSTAVAGAVCGNLANRGFDMTFICTGAIEWLTHTADENLVQVAASFPLYLLYAPMAMLAAIPFVASDWLRRHRLNALLVVLAALPLFVIANDYGRWISLIYLQLAMCVMVSGRALGGYRWSALTAIPYVTLWGFAHWTETWEPVGLVPWLIEEVGRIAAGG